MMKKLVIVFASLCMASSLIADTATVDGITWTYTVSNGKAEVGNTPNESTTGEITIPSSLGGCPVTRIANSAFYGCTSLTSVTIPDGVTSIGEYAFYYCTNLTSVTIGDGVTSIGNYAFSKCSGLTSMTLPDSMSSVPSSTFDDCPKLWAAWFRKLSESNPVVNLTVTNVVVHYVTNSVPSAAVIPPVTDGIVNVISEVTASKAIAIPSEWADQYPSFATKFGSDITAAVTQPTGKTDSMGRPMMVWQDFVAGTDPTNLDDVFRATIVFDKDTNKPVIGWTPELSTEEAAKRTYRIFGKVRLNDGDWTEINGDEEDYNFFKVTVEMK